MRVACGEGQKIKGERLGAVCVRVCVSMPARRDGLRCAAFTTAPAPRAYLVTGAVSVDAGNGHHINVGRVEHHKNGVNVVDACVWRVAGSRRLVTRRGIHVPTHSYSFCCSGASGARTCIAVNHNLAAAILGDNAAAWGGALVG